MLQYDKRLKQFSRTLRKNMTDAEMLLWAKIRGRQLKGHQFYRQKVIGSYIVDFYCPKAKLVIEVDGGQHYSAEGIDKDKIRDAFVEESGLKVIRFSDREVCKNLRGVIEKIWGYL
jgi:very-short-patch-repair endonuclease